MAPPIYLIIIDYYLIKRFISQGHVHFEIGGGASNRNNPYGIGGFTARALKFRQEYFKRGRPLPDRYV
jgi:hypothetical protein